MANVLFRSPVLTQSGYGVHARQIFRYLLDTCERNNHELDVQILHWGDTPWILNSDACDGLIGKAMSRSVTIDEKSKKYDVTVQLQLPNEWDPNLGKVNIGISAGIEADICHKEWIAACLKMDKVVVPSAFSKQSFMNTASSSLETTVIDKKIVVISESFPDLFAESSHSDRSFNYEFSKNNVLIIGQITGLNATNDRKNLFYTIKWLCEALSKKDDWGVVIKTNAARNTNIDRQIVLNMFNQLLKEARPKRKNPRIHIIHGTLSDEDLLNLYCDKRIKAFVSLTRGEGFGLPLLEAASTGLPIIATNWSGHLDFLKDQFMKVPYELMPVPDSRSKKGIFAPESKWANPLEVEFKKSLMSFVNHKQYTATHINLAKKLKKRVQKDYKFDLKNYEKELERYFK